MGNVRRLSSRPHLPERQQPQCPQPQPLCNLRRHVAFPDNEIRQIQRAPEESRERATPFRAICRRRSGLPFQFPWLIGKAPNGEANALGCKVVDVEMIAILYASLPATFALAIQIHAG